MTSTDDVLRELDELLAGADADLAAGWPGEPAGRQPVHTFYLPADRAGPGVLGELGRAALDSVADQDPGSMARVTGLDPALVEQVWPRVLAKLDREPVEDLRLDLEDGYGRRADDEEDRHAAAAGELLASLDGDVAPIAFGVRVKSLEASTRARCVSSLDLVSATLGAVVPESFVVTLPKVTSVEQVRAMVRLCERLEESHGFRSGSLHFELQVETPQAVLGGDGTATVARAVHAAAGRCTGLHYGTYDYSAALGVAAAHQALDHPVADHAKAVMSVAAAQTGVRVSDGSTNVLPVGERAHVEAAWALHARLVRRSLERGIYQGWDLHPAQLPTRYLATFAFFRSGLAAATERLTAYLDRRAGGVLDEPATASALAGFLLRGVDCGALDAAEVLAPGGPEMAELRRLARRTATAMPLDTLSPGDLRLVLFDVCTSKRWVDEVAAAAPYGNIAGLLRAAEDALAALSDAGLDEAMGGHPRIGERSEHTSPQREQSGVDDATREALTEGNRAYETRFGHVYLVCATGRSGIELLDELRSRLDNDPAYERSVARAELAKINRLRLLRLVEQGGPTT